MPQSIQLLQNPAVRVADIRIADAVAEVVVPVGNTVVALAEEVLTKVAVPAREVPVLTPAMAAPVLAVPVPAPVAGVPFVAVRCRELLFRIVCRNFLLLFGCRSWYKTSIKPLPIITLCLSDRIYVNSIVLGADSQYNIHHEITYNDFFMIFVENKSLFWYTYLIQASR